MRVTDGVEREWREGARAEERGGREVPTVIGAGEAERRRGRERKSEEEIEEEERANEKVRGLGFRKVKGLGFRKGKADRLRQTD